MTVDPVRYQVLRNACASLGYWHPARWGTPQPFDLFLYGVRSAAPGGSDRFDDLVGIAWADEEGAYMVEEWPATTDPGAAALEVASNPYGCATLLSGQYRACWRPGEHHPGTEGAYPCLVPADGWTAPVYRGADRSTIHRDGRMIELHHAGESSTWVGLWSAGCQVLQHAPDLARVLDLVREQARRGLGDRVSYTLFTAGQVG